MAAGERIFQVIDEPVTIEDRPGAIACCCSVILSP